MPRLILASSSPRRRQLLTESGFSFDVVPPREDAESGASSSLSPAELVEELARRKSDDVLQRLVATSNKEPTAVLAADTVAECQGEILGKPVDEDHARKMLCQLSGQEHRVYTGFRLTVVGLQQTAPPQSGVVVTLLCMDKLSDAWLDDFLASGKWKGKAGAFGLQDGLDSVHVIEGSETNVVGLPMDEVTASLAAVGCHPKS